MQTVLVTGAAGAVGSRLCRLLRAEGYRVVGVDLPGARSSGSGPGGEADGQVPDGEVPPGAAASAAGALDDLVGVDLADPATGSEVLGRAVAGADAVVHLAWRIPEGPGRRRRHQDVNEANGRTLATVLAAASGTDVRFVVLVSSATVYGAWPDNPVPLSEDAPLRPNPGFAFAAGKVDAEHLLTAWAEQNPGVATALLRPTVTVGGAEPPLYQALGVTRAPRGADRNRPVQYLHVDDLVSAIAVVLGRRAVGPFNVAPDAGIREDTARALAGGLARVALPARWAGAVASWTWDLWRSGIPKEALPYSLHPWVVAPDRLKAQGWTPRYSSEEALVATDVRPHWDDLPPGRRQNYTLAAFAGGASVLAGGAAAGLVSWRRRRRR